MQLERLYPSSLALPRASQDYEGKLFQVSEIGTDQVATWVATGGNNFVWRALTPSYVGDVNGLTALDPFTMQVGAWAEIDQPLVTAGVHPPTGYAGGVKMKRLRVQVGLSPDGVTKIWQVMGEQNLFTFVGVPAAPVTANDTLAGTSDVICEFGVLPGGLLPLLIGSEILVRGFFGRTGATGTATAGFALGTTSGTIGTAISTGGLVANANSVVWVEGSLGIAAAAVELASFSLAPGSAANVSANVAQTVNLANPAILQAFITNATAGQTFQLLSVRVDIR